MGVCLAMQGLWVLFLGGGWGVNWDPICHGETGLDTATTELEYGN